MFSDCYILRNVKLDSAESVDADAFANCYLLKNIYMPELKHLINVNEPDEGTFYRCFNLTEVSFPLVQEIPELCFNDCEKLVKADFESAVYIGYSAFGYCYELNEIYFPKLKEINSKGFFSTALIDTNLPSLVTVGEEAFCNSTISSLYAPNLEIIESNAFSYLRMETHIQNKTFKHLYAPKLTTLSDKAMAYASGIEELDLPSLKTIGENAFYESGVNYLYAPELEAAESLPVAEDAVVVVSDKLTNCTYVPQNTTLTIQGDKGSYGEEYADANNLEFIDMNDMGGSIRVTDAGLRFGYSFYDTQKKDVEEYGFVYAAGEQDRNDLTVEQIDNESVLQLVAYNRLTHENETTTFNLVFTDIPQGSYDMEVTARAYVKIGGKYFYSDVTTRSFNQVANAVLADDEIDRNTKNALTRLYEEV